jgi:hypothetical protein
MITVEEFNKIPHGDVFATGEIENSQKGIYMTTDGGILKWAAKKGDANDWAVYCYWNHASLAYVLSNGQKVSNNENIQKCVPCEKGVLKLYRH